MQKIQSHQQLKLRIVICGDSSTGRTSFIKRFCYPWLYGYHYDFGDKFLKWDDQLEIFVSFVVYPFQRMTPNYCKGFHGAIFMYDSSISPQSFNHSLEWAIRFKKSFDRHCRLNEHLVPCVLVGSKCDLRSPSHTEESEQNLKYHEKTNGFVSSVFVSAKEMFNLDESVRLLIYHILSILNP